ncbi:MAG: hypothetical protein IPF99_21995 [Deltaproteobacteria bacterium]|nr:hypothetical protein [Deltaproteobacteria bacterium]
MNARDECGVCGGALTAGRTADYARCRRCGHERRRGAGATLPMLNEHLDAGAIRRGSALGRFQSGVTDACAAERETLLDVGCGSGGIPARAAQAVSPRRQGEVSPACREFARRELGLRVEESVPSDLPPLSVVTFWHSLEHLTLAQIDGALGAVRGQCSPRTRVIVCVPNAASALYQFIGERYPYFDAEEHPQQFTEDSLDRVMVRGGFVLERRLFALGYSSFGYLQGLLNARPPRATSSISG